MCSEIMQSLPLLIHGTWCFNDPNGLQIGFQWLGLYFWVLGFSTIYHTPLRQKGEAVFQHFSGSFLKKGSEEKLLDKGYHYEGKGITRQLVLGS